MRFQWKNLLAGLPVLGATSAAAAQDVSMDPEAMSNQLGSYIALATPYVLKAVGALFLFIVARMVAGWAGKSIRRVLESRKFDLTLTRFFANAARILVMVGAVLGILGMFGVETTSFAAVLGAAGLAVGLAFQGTLSNFAAGVMLLTFRPFKVGDVVEVGGILGTVQEIDLFTSSILSLDNRRVIMPNSKISGETICNLSAEPKRRVMVDVGTDYGADLDKTRQVLEGVVDKVAGRNDDPTDVVLTGLGDSSINWNLRVWCESANYWAVYQALTRDAKVALDGAGIGIPFPQMDVHLDKVGG